MSADTRITMPSEAAEPCPSPMSWADVVQHVRTESQPWEVSRGTYVLRGKTLGTGLPLYFLNGVTGDSDLFALMVWLLKDEFRCVMYDYPDLAARNASGKPLSIGDYADDLCAVMDAHHDHSVAAYAVSFGVPVLAVAMRQFPERFARVVFQGGQRRLPITRLERTALSAAALLPLTLKQLPLRETICRQNHRAWFPPFDFSRWSFYSDATGDISLKTLAHRLLLMHRTDLTDVLPHLQQPVLVVGTEGEGPRLTAQRQDFAQRVPHPQTEVLDTTGLVPFLTHPHRLKKVIQPFLNCTENCETK